MTQTETKKPGRGRPLKYKRFIAQLEDDKVYSPAIIVREGERKGLIEENKSEKEKAKERLRIRHTLARFSTNHHFPYEGDGIVILKGQPPTRGWLGIRWKEAAGLKAKACQAGEGRTGESPLQGEASRKMAGSHHAQSFGP